MSDDPTITPRLGAELGPRQRCSFEPSDGVYCDQPGVAHIIWDAQIENGVTCAEHLPVAKQFAYLAIHDLAWPCSLPGSRFVIEENVCVVPDDLDPLARMAGVAMELPVGGVA